MVSNLITLFCMIRRRHSDFFQRLIQDIAKLFAVLIGKNIDEVEEELDLAYDEWLKLDRKSLDEMEPEELLNTLTDEMELDVDHIEIVAELSEKEGMLYFNEKDFLNSKTKLEKALKLYDFVDQERQLFSFQRQASLQKIRDLISKIESNYKNDNN